VPLGPCHSLGFEGEAAGVDAGRSLARLAVCTVGGFRDNRPGDLGVCVVVERVVFKGGAGQEDFERFARRVSPALLRSAFLLTRDRGHAEDLLQMTLLRVARRWEAIEESPQAFAYRVLVNLSRDRRRNLGRRPIEAPNSARQGDAVSQDVSERVLERDVMTALVRRLPTKQREVIVLRFLVDLSVAETAVVLGCSEGTVKSHTSRALASIRAFMAESRIGDRWMEVPRAE
jgi:RNA polymerase sigma-70 factor (sigma-E family)